MKKVNQKNFVKKQYKDPSRFAKRRVLHEKFSTNKYDWYEWVFDYFNFSANNKILELGSGLGTLWVNNKKRIKDDWDITLSDFSEEMLDKLKENLKDIKHTFDFKLINAEKISYPDATFDVVIANGLLYLISDLESAIKEIARVIKPGGILIASTSGSKYMKEIEDLIIKNNLPVRKNYTKYSFSLDNGEELLSSYFSNIELFRKGDSLLVTEAKPLVEHILSTNENLSKEQVERVYNFFDEYFKENKQLKVTIDTGLFIAKKV